MELQYNNNDNHYKKILDILKLEFNMSDRLILKLKRNNNIYLNGNNAYVWSPISDGDNITILLDFEEDNSNIVSTPMNLNILFEDESLLIVNKPSSMPVHPSCSHYLDSLSNGIKYYFDSINFKKKIRPINRLDKDTSGIVLFAKNEYIQECLVKQMKSKEFIKEYIAILNGVLSTQKGIINAPISRKEGSIIERTISPNGDVAITHYEVIGTINNMSLVKFILETGRTHQIRVHSSFIGHPIIGDTLYGTSSNIIDRQALHAYKVSFIHPITKKQISITANLPDDIRNIVELKNDLLLSI